MMFGYQVNEHIQLKILEEHEAEQLFTLVETSRNYLEEFLPFVPLTKQVSDSQAFIKAGLQQFAQGNGFPYPL